ncbi:MAG: hypothetical protein Udaeo_02930 [Candidatus Udaeobacter sp.]|nr:MAG: hypothetical protein Udaeo_02930 [Candidatus Udaeobacter sp.]
MSVNLAKLAESTCSRSNWTRIQPVIAPPNANAASGKASPAGRLSPSIPQAQKISAPRTTLTIKAAADPPIAEIPCSSIRCRPLAEAWIAAARRNRARWRFFSTARPAPALWKMPTTKTRLPFFDQNLISTFTGCYRLGNIDAIRLQRQETDANLFRSAFVRRAKRNYQSIAYAKLFSRSHAAVIRAYYITLREARSLARPKLPSTKRRPNGRQIRFKWYDKNDLPVGYVGVVRRVRAKDNNCQSACRKERN